LKSLIALGCSCPPPPLKSMVKWKLYFSLKRFPKSKYFPKFIFMTNLLFVCCVWHNYGNSIIKLLVLFLCFRKWVCCILLAGNNLLGRIHFHHMPSAWQKMFPIQMPCIGHWICLLMNCQYLRMILTQQTEVGIVSILPPQSFFVPASCISTVISSHRLFTVARCKTKVIFKSLDLWFYF